jgi:ankyrin repeat protein
LRARKGGPRIKVVRELLAWGAAVDAADDNGWTPLYAASYNGHVEPARRAAAGRSERNGD